MVPFQARRLRLEHASAEDTSWLRTVLDGYARGLGTRVEHGDGGTLTVRALR